MRTMLEEHVPKYRVINGVYYELPISMEKGQKYKMIDGHRYVERRYPDALKEDEND